MRPIGIFRVVAMALVCAASGAWAVSEASPADPESTFLHPPESAKPGVLWMWMGSCITKEGITKDLEALKAAGFGRTTMFSLSDLTIPWPTGIRKSPTPDIVAWTEPWWKLVKHAALESKRLGMDFGMYNGPGYESSGGNWITPELSIQQLIFSEVAVDGGNKLKINVPRPKVDLHRPNDGYNQATGKGEYPVVPERGTYYKDIALLAMPAEGIVPMEKIVDLTGSMSNDGSLACDLPAGKWRLYRIGHTTEGRTVTPTQLEATGFECDKMSPKAVSFHMDHVIGEIRKHLGDLVGTAFTHVHFDSYEAGTPNWTPGMREEFKKRRGYDPLPFLVTIAHQNFVGTAEDGAPLPDSQPRRIIGSNEESNRFAGEFAATISDLFNDVYFTTIRNKLHDANLDFLCEPYGGPWRQDEIMPKVDRVMTEFWTDNGQYSPFQVDNTVAAIRKSGQNLIEAEAFTGGPEASRWTETPEWLKPIGDAAYCAGINRFVLHRFPHQPFDERYKPGATMGWWGTHFDRTQTWWEPGKAMVSYWQRCQALLQWGNWVDDAEVVKVVPSGTANSGIVISCSSFQPTYPVANATDGNPETFWVSNGVQTGQGPSTEKPEWISFEYQSPRTVGSLTLSPRVGYGPKDCQFQSSVDGKSWKTIKAFAAGPEPWMKVDFEPVQAAFFRLLVTSSHGPENTQICELKLLKPGETSAPPPPPRLKWKCIHRRGGSTDVFFVANTERKAGNAMCVLPASGRIPELWDPVTLKMRDLPDYRVKDGKTFIPLEFDVAQSFFIVFRRDASAANAREGNRGVNFPQWQAVSTLSGDWTMQFDPQWGGPKEPVVSALFDWTTSADKGIRYFSGTVGYSKEFDCEQGLANGHLYLDLGVVRHMATVKLNGKDLGVVWCAPWNVEIPRGLIKAKGNLLEVGITNVWANRLIGDEQEPADVVWQQGPAPFDKWAYLKEFPDWFLLGKPRLSKGRYCFTTFNYFQDKSSPLISSGLLWPVRIIRAESQKPQVIKP